MKILLRILGYIRPYRHIAVLVYACLISTTLLNLTAPWLIGNAVDAALGVEREFRLFPDDWAGVDRLIGTAGLIIILALVRTVVNYGQRYGTQWLGRKVAYDIRMDLFTHLQRLPFSFYDRTRIGKLMSRVIGDVDEIRFFAGVVLGDMVNMLILLAGIYGVLYSISPELMLIVLVPMPFLFAVSFAFGIRIEPLFGKVRRARADMYARIQENLSQIVVVKAFSREEYARRKFQEDNVAVLDNWVRVAKVFTLALPTVWFLVGSLTFLLLLFGGQKVLNGSLSVGTLIAFNSYMGLLSLPAHRLAFMIDVTARAIANGKRIFSIIDSAPEITTPISAVNPGRLKGHIEFEDVSFVYPPGEDEPAVEVLHDVTFEAQPGTVTAIVGATGSGKTTLVNLVPRFYDVTDGCVCIDGVDVRDMPLKILRAQIGYVMQDTFLFNATIHENIAFGKPDATRHEVEEAAKAARAHEFIMEFPDGYDTLVGERGVTLSGGQRQRIAIARALLIDPRILILDDATASVDSRTEYKIREALRELMKGRTTLIIAQRLSTVMHADQILLLEDGRIVERGTHEELLRLDGRYARIWRLQSEQGLAEDVRGIGLCEDDFMRESPSTGHVPHHSLKDGGPLMG